MLNENKAGKQRGPVNLVLQRIRPGMTLTMLALRVGCSRRYMTYLFNGKTGMGTGIGARMAVALGISLDELVQKLGLGFGKRGPPVLAAVDKKELVKGVLRRTVRSMGSLKEMPEPMAAVERIRRRMKTEMKTTRTRSSKLK
jgi:hypothetical protein